MVLFFAAGSMIDMISYNDKTISSFALAADIDNEGKVYLEE